MQNLENYIDDKIGADIKKLGNKCSNYNLGISRLNEDFKSTNENMEKLLNEMEEIKEKVKSTESQLYSVIT